MNPTTAAIITVLAVFACVVAYQYIQDLRRRLETAQGDATTAWKLQKAAHAELCALKGRDVVDPYLPEPQNATRTATFSTFVPTGIGPTAINDRELRRELSEQQRDYQPSPSETATARHPTNEQIAAAARAASNGAR